MTSRVGRESSFAHWHTECQIIEFYRVLELACLKPRLFANRNDGLGASCDMPKLRA
jgi:hypothetical protein